MITHFAQIHPPENITQWVVLCGGLLGTIYLLLRPRFNKKRDPLTGGPKFSLAQHRQVERQMSDLLVELSEMARQISAQLDTRAAKLELLIREADEKIAALQARNQEPRPSMRIARAERDDAPSLLFSQPPAAPAPPADDRHASIYTLADQGHSANEIAHRLGRPSGEIELILALRPKV